MEVAEALPWDHGGTVHMEGSVDGQTGTVDRVDLGQIHEGNTWKLFLGALDNTLEFGHRGLFNWFHCTTQTTVDTTKLIQLKYLTYVL